jgi:hypothetical protein
MAFLFWTIGASLLVLLISAAAASHIRVRIRYSRSEEQDRLVIIVHALYGLIRSRRTVTSIMVRGMSLFLRENRTSGWAIGVKREEKEREIDWTAMRRSLRAFRAVRRYTVGFRPWAASVLRRVECTRWRLDLRVGTGDAASTAVVAGLLWAALGCMTAAAGQWMRLRAHPHGEVRPNYGAEEMTIVWEGDFRVRLGTMIVAFVKLGKRTVHLRRAWSAWKSWLSEPERAQRPHS